MVISFINSTALGSTAFKPRQVLSVFYTSTVISPDYQPDKSDLAPKSHFRVCHVGPLSVLIVIGQIPVEIDSVLEICSNKNC